MSPVTWKAFAAAGAALDAWAWDAHVDDHTAFKNKIHEWLLLHLAAKSRLEALWTL